MCSMRSEPPKPIWTPGVLDWLRYSGTSISVVLNPLHWRLIPAINDEPRDHWLGPKERRWSVSWLMVTVRIWIDDGTW